jgi:hypothetical protein
VSRPSPVAVWCERVIEGGWLLALLLIPAYFNLLSARHFEPDKATTLRSIVMIMLAAVLIHALEKISSLTSSCRRGRKRAPPGGVVSPLCRLPFRP